MSAAGKHSQPYPWEQRKLGDITRRYDNLRVPVTASKRKHGDIPYYGANGIQDFVSGYTHDGEFILVAEDGARDPKNYPVNYVNGKIWVNNHAHVLQGIQGLANNLFLLNGIKKINIVAYLVGGSRAKLNAETLMQLSIKLPSIHEQEKIGQLFQSLDKTITLHEEKHRQLERLKKALLQKMFADETGYPALRFKGFTAKWEQRKLGEIAEEVKGNSGSINNIPILTISAANGWMNQKDRFSQIIAGNELKKYTLLKKGELSYNHGNSKLAKYGTVFVQDSHDKALVPRVYHSFKMVAQNNPYFIEYLFASGLPNKELSKIVTSGARMDGLLNINKKEFFSIKLNNPSSEEQSSVAKLFQSLDKTITLHDKKIQYLKQLKRGLLQKMFV